MKMELKLLARVLNLNPSQLQIFITNCQGSHQLSFLLRILKRLQFKSPREIELEKLEKGFSIYLNGANAEASRKHPKTSSHKSVIPSPAWKPARNEGMLLLDLNKPADTQITLI